MVLILYIVSSFILALGMRTVFGDGWGAITLGVMGLLLVYINR